MILINPLNCLKKTQKLFRLCKAHTLTYIHKMFENLQKIDTKFCGARFIFTRKLLKNF